MPINLTMKGVLLPQKRLRILKVIHGYPLDYNAGSEVYSQSICEELSKHNDVMVFTREEDDYRLDFDIRIDERNGIPLTLINLPREKDGYEHTQVNEAFRKCLQNFQPDIIHIGHLNHLSLGIVDEAVNMNVPILFTLHDFWLMCPRGQFLQRNFDGENLYQLCDGQENQKCATSCYQMIHSCRPQDEEIDRMYWTNWIARRMESVRDILPKISHFIAPSRYLMNRFINDFGIDESRMTYLDYGFPTHYLTPVQYDQKRPFTIGYIGTHIPAKGVNLLIEAFKNIKEESQLIIWGRARGQNTKSLQKIAATSIQPIDFRGEYENSNIVQDVFEHIDAIVVPSIWGENSPLVIHEAQACGIPVITADFGGMKEYVVHQENGLLFKHRNVLSLEQQLRWAIGHPEEMRHLGQRGYLYSEDGKVPDIKHHCQSLVKVYKNLISVTVS